MHFYNTITTQVNLLSNTQVQVRKIKKSLTAKEHKGMRTSVLMPMCMPYSQSRNSLSSLFHMCSLPLSKALLRVQVTLASAWRLCGRWQLLVRAWYLPAAHWQPARRWLPACVRTPVSRQTPGMV